MPALMADTVTLVVDGARVQCDRGETLLLALLHARLPIETACGGKGTCHLCRLRVVEGRSALPEASALERRALGNVLVAQGMRLACQVQATDGLTLSLPVRQRGRDAKRKVLPR